MSSDASILEEGVVIVDTPGVGSTYEHNTAEAYALLPESDAALFLLSTDPPISEAEVRYLREIREYTDQIFFVQNKIDYLSPDELEESLEFCKRAIAEAIGQDRLQIYPVSAKLALDAKLAGQPGKLDQSGLPQLEGKLRSFLIEDKGGYLLRSVARTALRIISELELAFQAERCALNASLEEVLDKAAMLSRERDALVQEEEDSLYLLRGAVDTLLGGIASEIAAFKEDTIRGLCRELEQYQRDHPHIPAARLAQDLGELTMRRIREEFDRFREEETGRVERRYREIVARFSRRAQEHRERVAMASNLFGVAVDLGGVELEELTPESNFYYRLDEPEGLLSVNFKGLTALLPKALSYRLILSDACQRLEMLVDRQSGRIRYDFQERIQKSTSDFVSRFKGFAETALEMLEQAIDRSAELKRGGELAAQKALKGLEADWSRIREWRRRLERLNL